jgi:non-homologous end joining protein Ku
LQPTKEDREMRGDNHVLALTTTTDEITGEVKPLFSFPVQVCKATGSEADVKFDNAAPSGAEYEIKYVDPVTGETFEYAERLRGVRVGDTFKEIDADSIAAIEEATKVKTMVVAGKVPLDQMRAQYGDRAKGVYFLQSPAKGGSPTAYKLVYEALLPEMKGKKEVAPAQALVMKRTSRTRQKLNYVYACPERKCLVMVECEFAAAMRAPDEQVQASVKHAEVTDEQVAMARKVIAEKIGDGIPVMEAEVDEAVALKRDLVEAAVAGEGIEAPTRMSEKPVVDDPTDALMASLAA